MRKLVPLLALVICAGAFAEEEKKQSLADQLQSLNVPDNVAPTAVSEEKLYSVQTRFSPLTHRHEISLGGARNFTTDSFLVSNQLDLAYRFYLTDRWFLGASASHVFNQFTDAGERLLIREKLVADVAYTRDREDIHVGFNTFYGKFRLTMDSVFYFDQYVTLGPGSVEQNTGRKWAAVADAGLVFWMGHWGSLRVGLKDYFHHETRVITNGYVHNLLGHFELGVLL